jgi:hypothetical protein
MRRQRSKSWKHPRDYKGAKGPQRKRRHNARLGGQVFVFSALVAIAAWNYAPQATRAWKAAAMPWQTLERFEHSAYYPNCAAARAAGVAPIHRGQPGYRDELDADEDGVACEPYRGF